MIPPRRIASPDGPDPDLKHFSIDHDKDYILPGPLREARKVNPDLFLFPLRGAPRDG